MTEELEKLRDYLHAEKPALDTLEGVVSDIVVKNLSDREIIIKLCIRTGILQSFLKETVHDLLFISNCRKALVKDHFFGQSAAEKAIDYCKFLCGEVIEEKLIPYRNKKMCGFFNSYKELKIPCIYNNVKRFTFGVASVFKMEAGLWGYIDKNGYELTPFKYVRAHHLFDERAGFQDINRGYGFIDKFGKEIVKPKYQDIRSFNEGLAPVKHKDKWGYIDKDGDVVIGFLFDKAEHFSYGLAPVLNKGKYGFVNKAGDVVCQFNFEEADVFYEDRARVKYNGKWGFIDNSGNLIIKHKFLGADNFSEGFAEVRFGGILNSFSNRTWGYINKDGEQIFPDRFEHTHGFSEGYAGVKVNDKWGFIDDKGTTRIPCNYNYAAGFHNGLARIDDISRKFGFIDKANKMVIPLIYEDAEVFEEGFSMVTKDNRDGYINTEGVEFWED